MMLRLLACHYPAEGEREELNPPGAKGERQGKIGSNLLLKGHVEGSPSSALCDLTYSVLWHSACHLDMGKEWPLPFWAQGKALGQRGLRWAPVCPSSQLVLGQEIPSLSDHSLCACYEPSIMREISHSHEADGQSSNREMERRMLGSTECQESRTGATSTWSGLLEKLAQEGLPAS